MIVDLHEDISDYFLTAGATSVTQPFDEDVEGRHVDIPKYRKAGVRLVFGSIFPMVNGLNPRLIADLGGMYKEWSPASVPAAPREIAIEQVKTYYSLEEMYGKHLRMVRTGKDLDGLASKVGILLHLEGCEALSEPEDLRIFYRLGVRSIGLTWNYDNKYASSCRSRKDYGLTGEGEALVKMANRLGVMVDLSHAGTRTCRDVLEFSETPPFVSHADAYSVQKHPRNATDELIRKVGRRRGVIGLTFITSCIGEPADAAKLAEHAMHIARVGGAGTLALGTDYMGIRTTPTGLDDITKLNLLTDALKRKGANKEMAGKMMYSNAMNFVKRFADSWGGW